MADSKNILIVEDNSEWLKRLRIILERENYRVQTATSYGEALGELRRVVFHLVVVDLSLKPGDEENRDGEALLIDICEKRVPIIVVTGYGTTESAKKAFDEYGVFSFLSKATFDAEKFRHLVRQAIISNEEIRVRETSTLEQKKRFQEHNRESGRQSIVSTEKHRFVEKLAFIISILSGMLFLGGWILTLIGFTTPTKMEIGSWTVETESVGLVMVLLGVVLFLFSLRPLLRYLRSGK